MTTRDADPASPSPAGPGAGDAEEGPELPGLPKRSLLVFTAPGQLFDRLEERPVWLDVMLLVAGLSLAATLLIPQELVREAMMQQAPEGTAVEDVEEMTGFLRTAGMVAAVIGPLFVAAVVAGVTHLLFTLVLGGRSTYRQVFSAAAHMMLIPTVGTLLTVPLVLSTGDVQTALALHLLVPGLETDTYVYRLLHALNVFGIAGAVVMGVAVGHLYRDRSTRSGVAVMLILYVAMKALMSAFGGAPGP